MTTAEHMAVAVLKGDLTAARALADHLLGDLDGVSGEMLRPIKKITESIYNYRIVAYLKDDIVIDAVAFRAAVADWVREGGILMCTSVDRIEVYNE